MRILIIGGGASGLTAAISAACNGAEVTIFEKNDRLGKKILATGNGKCNLTNMNMDLSMYNTDDYTKLGRFFALFDEKETIVKFGEYGLMLKNKNGYIYPKCEQANAVLEVLVHMLDVLGVKVVTECGVLDIVPNGNGFDIKTTKGTEVFDRVIIATGSKAGLSKKDSSFAGKDGYYLAKKLGHNIIKVLPSLVQVECEEDFFPEIAGIRADCTVTLYNEEKAICREFGELQITDYGISGIPVFQISSEISRRLDNNETLRAVIDFMPEFDEDSFEEFINGRIRSFKGETVESFFAGLLNKKMNTLIIKQSGLKADDIVSGDIYTNLMQACMYMKQFVVTVKGTKDFSNAQVCCGGIALSDVNDSLESLQVPGLFLCGEVLNVDGKCGGYNLQWAWTSGTIAGIYAATI